MGVSVKEVLRRLCADSGWSYAVFWKAIQSGDQMRHLVWAGGHCQRTSISPAASGFEAMDMQIKESGVLRGFQHGSFSQIGCQAEDRVRTLVFKLMATQVHVVGEGIVGKAALTGKHDWSVGDLHIDNGSMSKVSAESNNQLLAGIKTMAIIPVLPHGVVQLGSTRMVLENFGVINLVKCLFRQLESVSEVLLSTATQKHFSQKIQLNESGRMHASVKQFREPGTIIKGLTSLSDDASNHVHPLHVSAGDVTEPSVSRIQFDNQTPVNFETTSAQENMSSSVMPYCTRSMDHCILNPIHHLNSQLESGCHEDQLMFSNPEARLVKNVSSCESNYGVQYQPATCLPHGRMTLLEEDIHSMPGLGTGQFVKDCGSTLSNTKMCTLQSDDCTSFNPLQCSETISVLGRGNQLDRATDVGRFNSFPSGTGSFRSQCADSFSTDVSKGSNPTDHLMTNQTFPGQFEPGYLKAVNKKSRSRSFAEKPKSNDHQFQDSDGQSTQFKAHGSSHSSLRGGHSEAILQGYMMYQDFACGETGRDLTPSENVNKGNENRSFLPSLDDKVTRCSLLSYSGNDLLDVLRLDQYKSGFSCGTLENVIIKDTSSDHELRADISTCITAMEEGPVYNALNEEICFNGMFSEANGDQLLDAVISQFTPGTKYEMEDNVSCKASLTKINSSVHHTKSPSNGCGVSPKQMHSDTCELPPVPMKSEPAASCSVKSSCSTERGEGCLPQSSGGHIAQINLLIEGQKLSCDNHSVILGKMVGEVGKQIRKRTRPGENPRPRPKDRQLIQDRVKELRELVPNGSKCSIDALLEKTIKHMLFLQSVTKHADKLKETGEPNIVNKEGGLLLKDNFEGGATWAFEVGSQSMSCPIIVEDLNPPRQMLVEMLCEERGLFLEIADLVRGLGLTILKGVMEARDDKVWARFAVEANRDVTRMEIFMSLLRLLEPSAVIDKAPKGVDNMNLPCMFHSPSPIPATGFSDHLW